MSIIRGNMGFSGCSNSTWPLPLFTGRRPDPPKLLGVVDGETQQKSQLQGSG